MSCESQPHALAPYESHEARRAPYYDKSPKPSTGLGPQVYASSVVSDQSRFMTAVTSSSPIFAVTRRVLPKSFKAAS